VFSGKTPEGLAASFFIGGVMSEETKTLAVLALTESNESLLEEIARVRNSNRLLRTIVRALRATNESLRARIEIATFTDEAFKAFCAGEFSDDVVTPVTMVDYQNDSVVDTQG
jgi:hypothetical protein